MFYVWRMLSAIVLSFCMQSFFSITLYGVPLTYCLIVEASINFNFVFLGMSYSWMLSTTYPVILIRYTSNLQRAAHIRWAELHIWIWKMKMIRFYMASSILLCRQQSASVIWTNYLVGRKQLQHLLYSFPSTGVCPLPFPTPIFGIFSCC